MGTPTEPYSTGVAADLRVDTSYWVGHFLELGFTFLRKGRAKMRTDSQRGHLRLTDISARNINVTVSYN